MSHGRLLSRSHPYPADRHICRMHGAVLISLLAVAVHATSGSVRLPSNFQICNRNNPNLSGCLKGAVENGIRALRGGSTQLDVQPLDPILFKSLVIAQGNGPVRISLDFKNLLLHGISTAKVVSANADLKNNKLSVTARLSALHLISKYTIKGQVLILPISGSGNCNITLSDTLATFDLDGQMVKKHGSTHLVFTTLKLGLTPQHVSMYFENLFNGDKALGENMNHFLNENWRDVYGELKDPIQNAFGKNFLELTNHIFSRVPFDNLFPN